MEQTEPMVVMELRVAKEKKERLVPMVIKEKLEPMVIKDKKEK